MKILISNDDGYHARGINALAQALAPLATKMVVVAPSTNCSGTSNALTLNRPLRVERADNGYYFVDGTPSDCVHIALTGMLDFKPDLIVSGINNGANLGDDTLYSGTVAAAMEGHLFGIPAIAFSLVERGWRYLDTAVHVARELVEEFGQRPLAPGTLLNVNIPNVPLHALKPAQVTRLGKRHPSEPVIKSTTPYGDPVYWIGPVGGVLDSAQGTDFGAIDDLAVSVTPLRFDLTAHDQLQTIAQWVNSE